MKLYDQTNMKIVNTKTIKDTNGATLYVDRVDEAVLNEAGYFKVEYQPTPNRRYYIATETEGVVGNKYVVGYTATERPLSEVKKAMLKDWAEYADQKENSMTIVTSLGIEVKANAVALTAFSIGAKRGKTYLRDKNYQKHAVTAQEMQTVYNEIEDNADAFFDLKGDKFDEIMALPTVQACIDYENFAEDYVVTQEDVDNDIEGTLTLGQIITRYKNKVKEW